MSSRVPRVPPMIASGVRANNVGREVIHRFHKRESCVFHNVHRFEAIFQPTRSGSLTCGDTEKERLFDRCALEQPACVDHRQTNPERV